MMFDGETSRWTTLTPVSEYAAVQFKATRHLGGDERRVLRGSEPPGLPAALEDTARVLAVDPLHGDEVLALRTRKLEDLSRMLM